MPVGTVILTVTATDADSGNFALIEYSLGDGEGKFAINPSTVSGRWGCWVLGMGRAQGQTCCCHPQFSGSATWPSLASGEGDDFSQVSTPHAEPPRH